MPTLSDRIASRLTSLATRIEGAPRADAGTTTVHGTTSGESGAAVSNALSGLGGWRDSGAIARPNTRRQYLDQAELVALMRGSVYRRIVELLPRWATVRGFTITDDTDERRPLSEAMRRLKVRDTIRRADIWGRALGESRILLVTDDMGRLDQPLVPKRVRQIHRLEVLDRREFTPVAYEGDVSRGPLGDPVLYSITPHRPTVGNLQGHVHASRLLRFYGDPIPPSETGWGVDGWGADAVGQTLWDGIRNLAGTGNAGARLAEEMSVAVYTIQSLGAQMGGDQMSALLSRLGLLNMMRSVANAVMLPSTDKYERVAANATGYRDLSEGARLTLALLTGYPLALLFGEAPSGLSTDASSWITNWHATVATHREERYREPLETLIEVMYYAEQGGPPEDWALEFPPLGDLSEAEKAQIRLTTTQADSAAILDGVLTPEEARSRYTEAGGFVFDLQPVEMRPPATELPPVDPSIEAGAQALVEAELARQQNTDADDFRGQTFKIPAGAKGNAAKVLRWKEKHGADVKGMTATGWARARQLAGDETVTGQDLIEMAAWFARHGAQAATRKVDPKFEGEPWRDAGWVAWLGWGGDTAQAWATSTVERSREDATEGAVWIGAVLPESARPAYQEARRLVEAVAGPLEAPGDDPHVTVLYMGQVAPDALPEVLAIAREVTERACPSEAEACHARTFAPSEGSDGKWPVVLDVGKAWGLWDLQAQLLPRLAHLITARQFPRYVAHLTLGYAADLTPEQQSAIAEVELPEAEWMIGGVQVRYGAQVVATLPLAGRTDAE